MNIPCIADLDTSLDDSTLISQFIGSEKYGVSRQRILAAVIRLFVQRHVQAVESDFPYTAISIGVELIPKEVSSDPRSVVTCL